MSDSRQSYKPAFLAGFSRLDNSTQTQTQTQLLTKLHAWWLNLLSFRRGCLARAGSRSVPTPP